MTANDDQRRWSEKRPWRRRDRVGVPADHFVKAPASMTKRQLAKALRKELARRRAARTRRI